MRAAILPVASIAAVGAAAAAFAAAKLSGPPPGQPASAAVSHQPAPSPPPAPPVVPATPPEPARAEPAVDDPRRAQIERDLVLDVALRSPRVLEMGDPIDLAATLRNVSGDRAHPVVLPGDGSEVGWREPHVYFTADIDDGDGEWQPVPEAALGRCGLYDYDWAKDVVVLAPGKALALTSWLGYPQHQLALRPGTVRLTVHYAYRPSVPRRSQVEPPPAMAGVPDFEIRSQPIVFQIVKGARP